METSGLPLLKTQDFAASNVPNCESWGNSGRGRLGARIAAERLSKHGACEFGVRRGQFLAWSGGARRTLCAGDEARGEKAVEYHARIPAESWKMPVATCFHTQLSRLGKFQLQISLRNILSG